MLLEIGHFFSAQRSGKLLLLLKSLAFGHQTIVQRARLLIGHEGIDSLADQAHVRLLQNRLTKFLCLTKDGRFFDHRFHGHTLIQDNGRKQSKARNFGPVSLCYSLSPGSRANLPAHASTIWLPWARSCCDWTRVKVESEQLANSECGRIADVSWINFPNW